MKTNLLAILKDEQVTFFNDALVDECTFSEVEEGLYISKLLVLEEGEEKFVYAIPGDTGVIYNMYDEVLEVV